MVFHHIITCTLRGKPTEIQRFLDTQRTMLDRITAERDYLRRFAYGKTITSTAKPPQTELEGKLEQGEEERQITFYLEFAKPEDWDYMLHEEPLHKEFNAAGVSSVIKGYVWHDFVDGVCD